MSCSLEFEPFSSFILNHWISTCVCRSWGRFKVENPCQRLDCCSFSWSLLGSVTFAREMWCSWPFRRRVLLWVCLNCLISAHLKVSCHLIMFCLSARPYLDSVSSSIARGREDRPYCTTLRCCCYSCLLPH